MKSLPQSYSSDSQLPSVLLAQLSNLKITDMSKFKDIRSYKEQYTKLIAQRVSQFWGHDSVCVQYSRENKANAENIFIYFKNRDRIILTVSVN